MYDLAAEQLKNFVTAYPSTNQGVDARYYLGLAQMKLKRYDEARVTFQDFALTYTDNAKAADAWLRVGDAYAASGNDREAASAYERVKVFHPKSNLVPVALTNAAGIYRKLGELEHAKTVYRSILQDYSGDKNSISARLALAQLYSDEGNVDLALRESKNAIDAGGNAEARAEALLIRGRIQASACLFDEAEKTYTTLIGGAQKSSNASLRAAYELGMLDLSSNSFASAIEHFRSVTKSKEADDSLRAAALFHIGECAKSQSNYPEARHNFEELISSYPESSLYEQSLLNAGRSALLEGKSDVVGMGGKPDVALKHARAMFALPHPQLRRQAILLASRSYRELNDNPAAIRYLQTYLDSFPNDPVVPRLLYNLGAETGGATGIRILEQMLQRFPGSNFADDALVAMAENYEASGNYREALRTREELQRRFPICTWQRANDVRIDLLKKYKIKDYDGGMKKLADITADVIAGKSKAGLAFRLGEVYFNELHEYGSSADQFSSAIDLGLSGDSLQRAYYLRARSYHLQSAIDTSARFKAATSYAELNKLYPANPWADEAAYAMYSLDGSRKKAEFLTDYPSSPYRGRVLLESATEAERKNDLAAEVKYYSDAISADTSLRVHLEAELWKGVAYQKLRMPDSAAACLKRAVKINFPGDFTLMAVKQLAEVYSGQKKFDLAEPLWKRYVTEFAIDNDDVSGLGEAYLENGKYDEAIALYQQELNNKLLDPFNEDLPANEYFYLGAAYAGKGDKTRAAAYYRQYLYTSRKGRFAGNAMYGLGALARAQGKNDLAAAYFKQSAVLGSASGSVTSDVAELLFQTEQYPEAARQYQLLAQQSDSLDQKKYYQSRAIIASLRSDKLTEAQPLLASFEKSYGTDKSARAELQYENALYYFRKQDYTTAKKLFENVAGDYANTRFGPYGQFYLGKILEVTNRLDDAAKKYTEIIKKFPSSDVLPRVSLSLGNMHFNAERYEDAIRHYQHILADSQKAGDVLPFAMNNLIQAYELTKLYDDAIRVTRIFIGRYPNDESILDKKIKLGTLFTQAGYYDQSILHLQSIMAEAGSLNEAELRYDIGEAYYDKGDYQQAVLEFLKVPYLVAKQGKVNWTATALYMAGQSYEKMSKFEEAIGMYQQIIDRPGIDATFKGGARKEIDRVKALIRK
jgi:TolA-binding protein